MDPACDPPGVRIEDRPDDLVARERARERAERKKRPEGDVWVLRRELHDHPDHRADEAGDEEREQRREQCLKTEKAPIHVNKESKEEDENSSSDSAEKKLVAFSSSAAAYLPQRTGGQRGRRQQEEREKGSSSYSEFREHFERFVMRMGSVPPRGALEAKEIVSERSRARAKQRSFAGGLLRHPDGVSANVPARCAVICAYFAKH